MQTLTIGQVARQAGVGLETLRFYEREGLLPEPPRRPSGYRAYPPDAVDRVRFIRCAKDLGFTLKEIRELLSLRLDPDSSCADVKDQAEAKLGDIQEKIRTLQRMEQTLAKLVASCAGRGSTSECPILEALETPDSERT